MSEERSVPVQRYGGFSPLAKGLQTAAGVKTVATAAASALSLSGDVVGTKYESADKG